MFWFPNFAFKRNNLHRYAAVLSKSDMQWAVDHDYSLEVGAVQGESILTHSLKPPGSNP
jgi:hypothetical protein